MNEADKNKPQQMTEEEARNSVLTIAAGFGVAALGIGAAYFSGEPIVQTAGGTVALTAGAATVAKVVNYVNRLS